MWALRAKKNAMAAIARPGMLGRGLSAPLRRPFSAPAASAAASAASTTDAIAAAEAAIAKQRLQPSQPIIRPPSSAIPQPSLPRPAPAPQPARPGFYPRRPLPPKIQKLIDQKLIPLRRKEHPEWLEKPRVRKMTLPERQKLLTAQYQEFDRRLLAKFLQKCHNPLASVAYMNRAHDWFIRVYNHAPIGLYHDMMAAAARFHQFARVDAYFKLLLRFHRPTARTLEVLLKCHASSGRTNSVRRVLKMMEEGALPLVQKKQRKPSIVAEWDGRLAHLKKLERNASFSFPLTERAAQHLLQSLAINNDTQSVVTLLDSLSAAPQEPKEGEGEAAVRPSGLRLTVPLAESFMHYFALHRLTDQCLRLLHLMEELQLPLSTTAAWYFFDAFKRRRAYGLLQQREVEEEQRVRSFQPPTDVPFAKPEASAQNQSAKQSFLPVAYSLKDNLPAHLRPIHPAMPAIVSPFPAALDSPQPPPGSHKNFLPSPRRSQQRKQRASPVDSLKETVDVADVFRDLLAEGFVPTAHLLNAYLSYYHENFYPPLGQFPDVMLRQVQVMREVFSQEAVDEAFERCKQANPDVEHNRPASDSPHALRSAAFAPFLPTSHTYSLLIQALLDRDPIRGFNLESLALHRPGPSAADLKTILSLRAEMRDRGVEPNLHTKINMMQLMVYEEKWTELYASFTLLWQAEQLRRQDKLRLIQRASPQHNMEQMLAQESREQEAEAARLAGEDQTAEEKEEKAEAESVSGNKSDPDAASVNLAFSNLQSSAPFTCMSLVPVFVSLSQRATLERFNLFFGLVSKAKDFHFTRAFFQCILQILADRGHSDDIVNLLKVMKVKYKIEPTLHQYNALLASILHDQPPPPMLVAEDPDLAAVTAPPPRDPQASMKRLLQTWELMKLLQLGTNAQTIVILLQGCLQFGSLADGHRLWKWINFLAPQRPTLHMYTLYVAFLLKHGCIVRALDVLRSQSFKDGLDWSLRECNMLLDFIIEGRLQRLGKRRAEQEEEDSGAASELDASGLTAKQKAALHVPSQSQLDLYQRIVSRAKALSLALLEHEKRGGKLGDLGLLELTQGTPTAHNLLLHRLHHSPMERLQCATTLADKDADEVTQHSTIPGRLFRAEMLPLIEDIEAYTGADRLHEKRKQQRQKVALLAGEVSQTERQIEEQRQKAQEELEQAVRMAKGLFAADDGTPAAEASAPPQSEQTNRNSTPAATSSEAAPSPAAASSADSAASPPASAATSSPTESTKRPAKKRATSAASKKAPKQASSAPSSATPKEPPVPLSPTAQRLQQTLASLSSKADRLYKPLPSTQPPSHPALFDAHNLCALRAEGKLDSLGIRDLKEVQTRAQLMGQPKPLLRGKKEHHLAVVEAWLDTCQCAAHQDSSSETQEETAALTPASELPSL